MKIQRVLVITAALFVLLPAALSLARGMSPAQHRAMFERARQVKAHKNRFVVRALTAYGIDFHLNKEGDVAMIEMEDNWRRVHAVEVVPTLAEEENRTTVTGHTIYFSTDSGWVSIHMTGTAW